VQGSGSSGGFDPVLELIGVHVCHCSLVARRSDKQKIWNQIETRFFFPSVRYTRWNPGGRKERKKNQKRKYALKMAVCGTQEGTIQASRR
jgi:hypothetical protein